MHWAAYVPHGVKEVISDAKNKAGLDHCVGHCPIGDRASKPGTRAGSLSLDDRGNAGYPAVIVNHSGGIDFGTAHIVSHERQRKIISLTKESG